MQSLVDLFAWLFMLPFRLTEGWPTWLQVAVVAIGTPVMLAHFVLWVLWRIDRHTARSEPGHQFGGRR